MLHLDANRAEIDVYNMGWTAYLAQRETDERRRKRERLNAERKADALMDQANKMRAKATKAQAAQSMMQAGREADGRRRGRAPRRPGGPDQVPGAGAVRQDAADRERAVEVLRVARGVHRRRPGDRQGLPGGRSWASTVPARPRCCGILAGVDQPDTGEVEPGHGLKLGYYAQEHETLDTSRTVLENMHSAAPAAHRHRGPLGARARSCSAATTPSKPARVLSGGEKTRLALAILVVSSANVLLLDEPTNNLDPASREEVLAAIRTYEGAIVLVTHDEGAVHALEPDRVLILPDGVEDLWNADVRRPGLAGVSLTRE